MRAVSQAHRPQPWRRDLRQLRQAARERIAMSASNWAECPQCKKRQAKAIEDALVAAGKLYGTVPQSEYLAAVKAAQGIATEALNDGGGTLREDYGIYGAEDGIVKVSYYASCTRCGLEMGFESEHPLPLEED
jgi:hypothetical protein